MNRKTSTELRKAFQILCPGIEVNIRGAKVSELIVVERAQGARIWDMDGTEYLDYAGAYGPNILGHRHPEYLKALHQLMDTSALCVGGNFGMTEGYVAAAEKIVQHIPCAERVKFLSSGSEAVQAAFRIARAYTGRPYVLVFQDHYHGWIDSVADLDIELDAAGKSVAVSREASLGHAPCAKEETLMIEWNNIGVLEAVLEKYGDQIALIAMEAFASNAGGRLPRPGYLEQVRKLCDHYGIVLCFDEVLTGFRVGLNGAQGLFGITPDISTLGKALGGGMPVGAVVGKAEIMDIMQDGKTHFYGTYMGHSLTVEGVNATLGILACDEGAVYKEMERVQKRLISGLDEIARRRGIPLRVQGLTGLCSTLFGVDPDTEQYSRADAKGIDHEMALKFSEYIKRQGISTAVTRWFSSIMHTDRDTDIALDAADKAMAQL